MAKSMIETIKIDSVDKMKELHVSWDEAKRDIGGDITFSIGECSVTVPMDDINSALLVCANPDWQEKMVVVKPIHETRFFKPLDVIATKDIAVGEHVKCTVPFDVNNELLEKWALDAGFTKPSKRK